MANNSAQKKYKLFGRRSESKDQSYNSRSVDQIQINDSSAYSDGYNNGLSDYCYTELPAHSQQNHNLLTNGSAMSSVSSVAHNHTYHMHNPDLNGMSPLSISSNQQWLISDNESDTRMRRFSSDCEGLTEEQQLNRDEKRAKALKIPIATYDIINLPIDEFNERLAKYELNEAQLSLIRDIRRRGMWLLAFYSCHESWKNAPIRQLD